MCFFFIFFILLYPFHSFKCSRQSTDSSKQLRTQDKNKGLIWNDSLVNQDTDQHYPMHLCSLKENQPSFKDLLQKIQSITKVMKHTLRLSSSRLTSYIDRQSKRLRYCLFYQRHNFLLSLQRLIIQIPLVKRANLRNFGTSPSILMLQIRILESVSYLWSSFVHGMYWGANFSSVQGRLTPYRTALLTWPRRRRTHHGYCREPW